MSAAGTAAPEIAAELLHRLFVLLKAAAVYGPGNDGYKAHSAEARATLREALSARSCARIEAREDRILFNDAPIRLPPGDAGARFLAAEMRRRGVGSLEFRGARAVEQLDAFAFAFNGTPARRERTLAELRRLLLAAGATDIAALPPENPEEAPPAPESGADAARRTFLQAVDVVEDLMTRARDGRDPDLDSAKRVAQGLAERVIADAQALFELSLLQRFDEYTYAHSVNVCVYSIAIGVRLGLDAGRISELGFGALFHDVGKAKLPRKLIDKPDELDEDDWRLMRRHPVLGAKTLLAMRRPLDAALARAISIAFEHHLGMDGSGYPKLPRPRRQELFSRICAVADAFDAMTSGRVYAKRALSPDEALRRMVQRAGTAFDPLLLRLFINTAGVFPIGTALLLDTGERSVVARNDPADLLRPKVIVYAGRDGKKTELEIADLARRDAGTGKPLRSIRRTLDPREQDIDARDVLRRRPAIEGRRSTSPA